MNPNRSANTGPAIQKCRRGLGHIDTAMAATVVVILPTKGAAPIGVVQAVASIEWHPIIDIDIVVPAIRAPIEIAGGLFGIDTK